MLTGAAETFDDGDLTRDAFLGGRLTLLQPRAGYRAAIDPVLLAAAVPARAGQSVLDLGCGAGAALYCLGARVTGLSLHGLELQPAYADLARRNAALNGLATQIHEGDVTRMPGELRAMSFDHVLLNPPYYPGGTPATDPGRAAALTESHALDTWIGAGARRVAPKGMLSVIQRADRLPDLVAAMAGRVGSLRIRPLQPRTGRPASLVIVQGVRGGRAPAILDAPVLLHQGDTHRRDGDDYAPQLRAVLRNAASLA